MSLAAEGRSIVDANIYMILGTADEDGRPWASPVWYACEDYTEFFWVSSPDTTHSLNIAARPEVGVVIFDSQVQISTGQAVYMRAVAERLTAADRGIDVFSRRSQQHGARAWTPEDVEPPARLRLYRTTATEQWVLDPAAVGDERTPVRPRRTG
jgi:hypothetical protein